MRTILTISCALGALIAAQPALAQDAGGTAETQATEVQGNDIVVTARRQSERLQDVPIAITAVSGGELDSRGLSNVTEIAQITPNLQFTPGQGGNSGGIAPFIRGVGENDFIITADPAVGVYIDGVYVARTFGATTELLGIDRIEVLRGPQGTLFGKNTVGGAISVVSSIPGQDTRVEADVRYGSFDDVRVRVLAETPLTDTLSVGVSGFGEWGDGWQKVPSGKNLSNRNVIAGKLALHYDASPFDAVLLVDGLHRDQNSAAHSMLAFTPSAPFAGLQAAFLTPCCTPNSSIDRTDTTPYFNVDKTDAINASLTLSYDMGSATLKSISAYRHVDALFGRDGDASATINYAGDRHDETARQLSQELQLSLDLGGRGSILIGAFAYQEKTRDLTRLIVADGLYPAMVAAVGNTFMGLPTSFFDLNIDFDNRQTTTNYAVFSNANYKLTDAFTIELGARYTWEKKRFTQAATRIYSNLPLLAGTPEYTLEQSWDAFTPRASLSYDFRPGLKAYASFSRGFRSGGFNGRPTSLEEIGSYDPEFLTAYEAGIKADFGRYVTVNVAAFRNEYRDQQLLVNTVSNSGLIVSRNENAGRSRIQGLEVEAVARVTPRFTVSGSLGLLDAKYLEYTTILNGTATDMTFRIPKQAPEITANASAVYRTPLGDALDGVFRVDAAYRSKTFIDVENSPLLVAPDHAIVNASAEFAHVDSGVSLRFAVDNLTNKQVLRAGFDGTPAFGFVEGFYTDPRRYWVTLRIAR